MGMKETPTLAEVKKWGRALCSEGAESRKIEHLKKRRSRRKDVKGDHKKGVGGSGCNEAKRAFV